MDNSGRKKEIRQKLAQNGYIISEGDYSVPLGLISGKENSEYVIADIREGEGLVVIQRHENQAETEAEKNLMKILSKQDFRNTPRTHD